jgi:hypothetical protein
MPRILIVIGDEFMAQARKNHELAAPDINVEHQYCDGRHTPIVNRVVLIPFAQESAISEKF